MRAVCKQLRVPDEEVTPAGDGGLGPAAVGRRRKNEHKAPAAWLCRWKRGGRTGGMWDFRFQNVPYNEH